MDKKQLNDLSIRWTSFLEKFNLALKSSGNDNTGKWLAKADVALKDFYKELPKEPTKSLPDKDVIIKSIERVKNGKSNNRSIKK